ncbi:unnamed protein product [Rangifer tarandus platyrhynchus]|uniref:Basic proline-rich protein-like n=1 Tax=Rangifer tarandus platyrhynchus TaxID=3082113 RepID=A0ABN8Y785_RANTA|nr:unnamed protein product [Rangifer tarandus platyrhynchus]
MERKHYAGINPGLQLVEKAGPLAKTGQGARDAAYLSLAGPSPPPPPKGGQRGPQTALICRRKPYSPPALLAPRARGSHSPSPAGPFRPSTQLMPDLKQARDEKSKRCAAGHQPSVLPSGGGVRELPAAGWKPWGEGSSSAGGGWARVPAPPPPRLGRGSVRASPGVRSLTRLRGRGLRGSHCPGHPPPNLPLLPRAGPERPVPPRAPAWLFRGAGRPGARCERPRSPAWERQTRVVEPC